MDYKLDGASQNLKAEASVVLETLCLYDSRKINTKKKKIKQSEGTCMGGWRDTKRHVKESLELNKKKCEATPEGRNGSEKTKVP